MCRSKLFFCFNRARQEEMVLANMQIRPGEAWDYCPRSTLRKFTKILKDEFNLVNAHFSQHNTHTHRLLCWYISVWFVGNESRLWKWILSPQERLQVYLYKDFISTFFDLYIYHCGTYLESHLQRRERTVGAFWFHSLLLDFSIWCCIPYFTGNKFCTSIHKYCCWAGMPLDLWVLSNII